MLGQTITVRLNGVVRFAHHATHAQVEEAGFIDYLRGGMQINVIVGIDFTASNGSPQYAASLHHMSVVAQKIVLRVDSIAKFAGRRMR